MQSLQLIVLDFTVVFFQDLSGGYEPARISPTKEFGRIHSLLDVQPEESIMEYNVAAFSI